MPRLDTSVQLLRVSGALATALDHAEVARDAALQTDNLTLTINMTNLVASIHGEIEKVRVLRKQVTRSRDTTPASVESR